MKIIADTTEFHLDQETAVAMGKFDGVHLGHRRLLKEILDRRREGLSACVFTFDPSPGVLFGTSDGKELTTREEKRVLFERLGIDYLIEFPLTRESAGMAPEAFVKEILCKGLRARVVAAGEDLSFGAGGKGDAALLGRLAAECRYHAEIIEKVCLEGRIISSTDIREQVEAGNMPLAAKLLGTPYTVMGQVAAGRQLGRKLGLPTANLLVPAGKLMPPCGVYTSRVRVRDRFYRGLSNVGYKPTVTDEHVLGLETYLYDFEDQIYGERIEVSLLDFRRPERRFPSLDALKAQIREDLLDAGMEK